MTCIFLTKRQKVMPPEIGGSLTPNVILVDGCELGRDPGQIGWITNCENTPTNGPCWYWVDEHGTDIPDRGFEHSLSKRTTR